MKRKDCVIQAVDNLTTAIRALTRINYENENHALARLCDSQESLLVAVQLLQTAKDMPS